MIFSVHIRSEHKVAVTSRILTFVPMHVAGNVR